MVTSTGQANLGGHQIMGKADLGFVSPVTQNVLTKGTAIQEPAGCDLFVVAKFGGTVNVTLKLQQAATSALATAFGSPTSLVTITDTAEHTVHAALDPANGAWWVLGILENNVGAPTLSELAVASVVQVASGTMPESLQTVKTSVASTASPNAGDGRLTLL